MKKVFYLSVLTFIIFEILNVYFIMPFPGSQRINSLGAAYFLYSWRWTIRLGFGLLILTSAFAMRNSRWHLLALLPLMAVVYFFNFRFAADRMFLEPKEIVLKTAAENVVNGNRQIIGVTAADGAAKAYPIQFIAYHHKVRDTLGSKPILVTYCTVCRTGRVFEPVIDGNPTTFRLVGMDKFNAMFEDSATGSWWRQANGEAVEGELKGQKLPEVESTQTTLAQWLELNPSSLIMQPDQEFADKYESYARYEDGAGGSLTGRNAASWEDKSWIVGIQIGESAKAFDWNNLKEARIINDEIAGTPIVLVLGKDDKSFFAFERPARDVTFNLENNQLVSAQNIYDLAGKPLNDSAAQRLKKINAHQEFWHSWQTFHPNTESERHSE